MSDPHTHTQPEIDAAIERALAAAGLGAGDATQSSFIALMPTERIAVETPTDSADGD